jgi:hypothetical protein
MGDQYNFQRDQLMLRPALGEQEMLEIITQQRNAAAARLAS